MPIGKRLREERERLGLSQPAFAAIAQTTKQTLFSWETGKTAPDGFQLAALSVAGTDVLYILTGNRAESTLTSEEQTLVSYYREASPTVRRAALGALLGAAGVQAQAHHSVNIGDMNNSTPGGVQVGYSAGTVTVVGRNKRKRGD